jgi:hypothetical protein
MGRPVAPNLVFLDAKALEEILGESAKLTQHSVRHHQDSGAHGELFVAS